MTCTKEIVSLSVLLVAATAVRLLLAIRVHVATLDTAVVGQMAINILNGDRPLFFAGQTYMGALEAYALAGIFYWVPPGHATMTLATVGFTLAWIVVTYLFFRKQFGALAALAAATVPAMPGWTPVWYTTAPYGGYPQTYLFGMLLLWLGLRFWKLPAMPRTRCWHALALGVIAGLGIWTNLQILPYLAATGLAGLLAWKRNPRPFSAWLPYLLVPLLVTVAFLPQFLAEPAHIDPPMFEGLSAAAVSRSWRGLWSRDLSHCLLWIYPPRAIHLFIIVLLSTVLIGAIAMAILPGDPKPPPTRSTDVLVWSMLAVFCITYFPHPMSGFVPRYLVAPLVLLLCWALAVWVHHDAPIVRRAGILAALCLMLYNAYGIWHVTEVRAPRKQAELQQFTTVIEAARAQDWSTIMHAGSETEGYDAVRLTYTAGGRPLFTSAFGERFLPHQQAWETGAQPVLLSRQRVVPFLLGSYAAMQADPGLIVDCPPYALVENPPVQRQREFSTLPVRIRAQALAVDEHPLFDRSDKTTWPQSNALPQRIMLEFDPPVLVAGLRVLAPSPLELPYRYRIRTLSPDQEWRDIQISEQRIAASYLSGTHVYLRGFHPWMDMRFPAHTVSALEWEVDRGPANRTPPRLSHLFVLTTTAEAWPDLETSLESIFAHMLRHPDAHIIAERGILRLLHQYGQAHALDDALQARIPMPYNPRFRGTLRSRMPLPEAEIMMILEEGYAEGASRRLQSSGRPIQQIASVPPFVAYRIGSRADAEPSLQWRGFTVVQ